MLAERFTGSLRETLLSAADYHPYPTAEERGPWEALPGKLRHERIAQGEKYLGYQWPQLTATGFMEFARTGNRSNFESLTFAKRRALASLVLAECLEGQGRFLDEIINGIWLICEESFWGVPAHNYGPDPLPDVEEPYIDLFAGETVGLLAWTHYLLRVQLDHVSQRISKRLRHEIKMRVLDPYLERDDFWWLGFDSNRKVNNWNPWCNANCLTAFLLIEEDPNRRTAAVAKALRSLDQFLTVYHSDGGCDEGTSYWSRAGGSLFDCLELLFTATDGTLNVYGDPLIREIGRYLYRAYIDGNWFINFADGGARVQIAADLVYRYGKRIGDPNLMALGSSAHHQNPSSGLQHKDSIIRDLAALFNYDEIEAATDRPPHVRDVWLSGIEVMAARENDGSADGLYLAAKGGHNSESHNHNDVGNFIVYVDGKPAIIDAGVETYTAQTFSSRRYELWTMQSAYHNLPTIRRAQQRPGEAFRATDVMYMADDNHAELSLDLAKAYPTEAGVRAWKRSVRLNRGTPASVEVVDAFELTEATDDVVLNLLVASAPKIDDEGVVALDGARLHFDGGAWAASWETIAIDDRRLQHAWGQALYRIQFRPKHAADAGVWRLKVTKDPGSRL